MLLYCLKIRIGTSLARTQKVAIFQWPIVLLLGYCQALLTEISDLDPNAEYLGRTGTVLSVYLSQGIAIYSTDGTSRVINKSNNRYKMCSEYKNTSTWQHKQTIRQGTKRTHRLYRNRKGRVIRHRWKHSDRKQSFKTKQEIRTPKHPNAQTVTLITHCCRKIITFFTVCS